MKKQIYIAKLYGKMPVIGKKSFRGIEPMVFANFTKALDKINALSAIGINAEPHKACAGAGVYLKVI